MENPPNWTQHGEIKLDQSKISWNAENTAFIILTTPSSFKSFNILYVQNYTLKYRFMYFQILQQQI